MVDDGLIEKINQKFSTIANGVAKKLNQKTEEILNDLRAHELPGSLAAVINEQKADGERNIYDLFTAPEEIQELFFKLKGLFSPYTDSLISMVRAYKELDSSEKVKDFIFAELVDNNDPYDLIDYRYGYLGEGFQNLYKTLIDIANLDETEEEKLKPVLESISFFEEAGLEIILDMDMYFTKTRSGSPGTGSEFVGSMVDSIIPRYDSPLVKDGRYINRLMQAISYEDIVEGRITENDGQNFQYQENLLDTLHVIQTPDNPGEDYWRKIYQNPDFFDICYILANRGDNPDPWAGELLCKISIREYKSAGGNLAEFKNNMVVWVNDLFRDEYAHRKFLKDPDNEYETTLGKNLPEREKIKMPSLESYLAGPKVLVMTDYEREGDNAIVGYAEISNSIERKTITLNMKTMEAPGVPEDVGSALINMANDFEKFSSQYNQYLNKVKSRK